MRKTIGIFAHVDAGKTTFSEQILYHTNSIRSRGRVDHKDTFLDNHKIEKQRGITVFSDIGRFFYDDSEYYLIDTPGHIDFSPEMERTISILDYAIVLISAVEGIQGHTETVWELLKQHGIPTFIFINKLDREGADINRVIDEIKNNLEDNVCLFSNEELYGFSKEVIEFIATKDEKLLEHYFEEGYDRELWIEELKRLIKRREIVVINSGSALKDEGIKEFIQLFHELTYCDYEEKDDQGKAKVFKIRYDEKGNRITFVKVTKGNFKVKSDVEYRVKDNIFNEKINEIRRYSGNKFQVTDKAVAGEIVGLLGISNLKAGSSIGMKEEEYYKIVPTLKAKVLYDENLNSREVLKCFKLLEAEENTLNVVWNEELQELNISVMGTIQLEVIKEIAKDRFDLDVEFTSPEVLYKETIRSTVAGLGHFEPLRHYAEVHLKLEEGPRGSGIIFKNKCHPDFLSVGHQNLIKTHIFEKEHKGILTGSTITDLKITLVTGRAHLKHTEGGDFREATKRALRQGLECAENVLLEPYYKFKIDVDISLMGRIISDIQRFGGTLKEHRTYNNRIIIEGVGPVATFMNYPLEFQDITRGKGALSLVFYGYDLCHNSEDVILGKGYNKDADPEYTSSSVFCSRGVGYSVPWNEVKEHMHCLK